MRQRGEMLSSCKYMVAELNEGNEIIILMIEPNLELIKRYQFILLNNFNCDTTFTEETARVSRSKGYYDEQREIIGYDHWIEDKFQGYRLTNKEIIYRTYRLNQK